MDSLKHAMDSLKHAALLIELVELEDTWENLRVRWNDVGRPKIRESFLEHKLLGDMKAYIVRAADCVEAAGKDINLWSTSYYIREYERNVALITRFALVLTKAIEKYEHDKK